MSQVDQNLHVNGNPDVDLSITTRELAQMIKGANINFGELTDEEFDNPMGESTGGRSNLCQYRWCN